MDVTMEFKILIVLLVSFKAADALQTSIKWNVKEGEMMVLKCPFHADHDAKLKWIYPAAQDGMDQTNIQSPTGNRQMDVLTQGKYLIVLNVSTFHQGNYSCSLGNVSVHTWSLTVCSELLPTSPCLEETYYPQTCYQGTSNCTSNCTLRCPAHLNITGLSRNITAWHKENVSLRSSSYSYNLSAVEEKDRGLFTCTRSYLYDGQLYNQTHTIDLTVDNNTISEELPTIISPQNGDVFYRDVDSKLVVDCNAVLDSEFDEVYWITGDSFVDDNTKLPVYYNSTSETDGVTLKMTASLIFMKVSEEHLSTPYTCILDSTAGLYNVTISLRKRRLVS